MTLSMTISMSKSTRMTSMTRPTSMTISMIISRSKPRPV